MADSVCQAPSFFSMTLQKEILSTVTSDFLKMLILESFNNSMLKLKGEEIIRKTQDMLILLLISLLIKQF